MSDDEKPAIELTPTAVSVRAASVPTRAPELHLNFPRRGPRHAVSYEVTNITAVNMQTANAMMHISDNNVNHARVVEFGLTQRSRLSIIQDLARLGGLGGTLLLLARIAGPNLSAVHATAFGALCAVFGGLAIADKVLKARTPQESLPIVTPDALKPE